MGSFNETCALSGHAITYGTPVRLLFLTKQSSKYRRPVYHNDQWVARTPPIKGKYDDYGRAEFIENSVVKLIAERFDEDVVERPWGDNCCHDVAVIKGQGIHHYLEAAWEGRLLVRDEFRPPELDPPDPFPTWKRVHDLLVKYGFPIQKESFDDGFNAQHVSRGIVYLSYNSHNKCRPKLLAVKEKLSAHYDCELVKKFKDDNDLCLLITIKGGFKNNDLLFDIESVSMLLKNHPELRRKNCFGLPVLAVMIREDVWKAYCSLRHSTMFEKSKKTVKNIFEQLKEKMVKKDNGLYTWESGHQFREILLSSPLQVMLAEHLVAALKKDNFPDMDQLLQGCAELSRVEYIMSHLHQAWYIPMLSGQETNWELKLRYLTKMEAIAKKELKKERDD